jgi:hypothetical protein
MLLFFRSGDTSVFSKAELLVSWMDDSLAKRAF